MDLLPQLREIDQDFIKQSQTWAQFSDSTANRYGYQQVLNGIYGIREKIGGVRAASDFERLWFEDMSHQLDVQEALAHHYHGKPTMPVVNLVDFACGAGTYQLVEDGFKNYDHESAWKITREDSQRQKTSIPNNTREAHLSIEAYAPKVKAEILKLGVEQGFLPSHFDFPLDLALPGTYGRPFWNCELKRFYLGFDYFQCFEEGGVVRIDPSHAYAAAFHEILGHASQQTHSEGLPQSLQFSRDIVMNIPSRVVYEGLALHRERMAFDWLRQNADRLGLKPDEIDLSERKFEFGNLMVGSEIVLSFLKEREHFEGLNTREYMEQLEDNQRTSFRFSKPFDAGWKSPCTIERAFYEICYPAGFRTVGNVIQENGKSDDKRKLNASHATGLWGFKTYSRAVEYFLNQ